MNKESFKITMNNIVSHISSGGFLVIGNDTDKFTIWDEREIVPRLGFTLIREPQNSLNENGKFTRATNRTFKDNLLKFKKAIERIIELNDNLTVWNIRG